MSSYARRMAMLSAQIFGNLPRPLSYRSQKVIDMFKAKPLREEYSNYYPPLDRFNYLLLNLRKYGLYHNEYRDFKEEMTYRRKMRGKTPTKKGEGKRAKKK